MATKERKFKRGTPEAIEFLREQGAKGGRANVDKYGVDHMKTLGRKGGRSKLEKYGPEAFSDMGKKSRGGSTNAS